MIKQFWHLHKIQNRLEAQKTQEDIEFLFKIYPDLANTSIIPKKPTFQELADMMEIFKRHPPSSNPNKLKILTALSQEDVSKGLHSCPDFYYYSMFYLQYYHREIMKDNFPGEKGLLKKGNQFYMKLIKILNKSMAKNPDLECQISIFYPNLVKLIQKNK